MPLINIDSFIFLEYIIESACTKLSQQDAEKLRADMNQA